MVKAISIFAVCVFGFVHFTTQEIKWIVGGERLEAKILSRTLRSDYRCGLYLAGLLCHFGFVEEERKRHFSYLLRVEDQVFRLSDSRDRDVGTQVSVIFVSGDPESSKMLTGSFFERPWIPSIFSLYMCLVTGFLVYREFRSEPKQDSSPQ